jgi:hypothetical protein
MKALKETAGDFWIIGILLYIVSLLTGNVLWEIVAYLSLALASGMTVAEWIDQFQSWRKNRKRQTVTPII